MLHLRVFVPLDSSDAVLGALASIDGLYHVVSTGTTVGTGRRLIEADVPPTGADEVLGALSDLGIPTDDVLLLRQSPIRPIKGRRRYASAPDTLVWAEVVEEAREHALPLPRYFAYMAIAGLIAGFGVIDHNDVLIVGAMALSPDLMPLTAAVVGIVARRRRLARRATAVLVAGLCEAGVAALLITLFLKLTGTLPQHFAIGQGGIGILPVVGVDTFLIALGAGVAGMLAFETRAQSAVGVAISVTTIPAAAYAGVAVATGQLDKAGEASLVLLINVVCLLVAGSSTLIVQRWWDRYRAKTRSARRGAPIEEP